MNLWEILKASKGLPPPDLETLLFARKIGGQAVGGSTLKMLTASGYPCVLEGSAGMPILDYKIYGNSVQDGTPTPENPIEVQSVGDKTKNLFDKNDATVKGFIKVDGSISPISGEWFTTENFIKCSGGISLQAKNGLGSAAYISCYDSNKVFLGCVKQNSSNDITNTIQLIEGTEYIKTCCRENNLDSYQLELGSEVTAYEPYGYKIPVVVTGKNLFDASNTQWTNDYYLSETGNLLASSSWRVTDYIPVRGMVFTINNRIGVAPCICLYDANKNLIASQSYAGHKVTTVTANELAHYCRFSLYTGGGVSSDTAQLELGSEATAYEPYHEPITTNIYLDEPLRKIGDYADVLDYNQNIIKRKIGKLIFTGDEAIRSTHLDRNLFMLDMKGYLRTLEITSLSSHYQTQANVTGYTSVADMRCTFYADPSALSSSLLYIRDSRFSTIADFKSYLTQQYDAGTPVTAYYAFADPITEPISIPSIPTFDGTTVISTDAEIQPSNMEIKYKARK